MPLALALAALPSHSVAAG